MLFSRMYYGLCWVVSGMKRPLEEEEMGDGASLEDSTTLKRRRGDGPHVELRVLLASKVNTSN